MPASRLSTPLKHTGIVIDCRRNRIDDLTKPPGWTKRKTVMKRRLTPMAYQATLHWMLECLEDPIETFLQVMKYWATASDDPSGGKAQAILDAYDARSPKKQQSVLLDDLCQEAGVAPSDAFGWFSAGAFKMGLNTARVIAGIQFPQMMAASMARAQQVDTGGDERKMHFEASGYLPRRGGGIAIQNNIQHPGGRDDDDDEDGPGQLGRSVVDVVRALPPDSRTPPASDPIEAACTPSRSSTSE